MQSQHNSKINIISWEFDNFKQLKLKTEEFYVFMNVTMDKIGNTDNSKAYISLNSDSFILTSFDKQIQNIIKHKARKQKNTPTEPVNCMFILILNTLIYYVFYI